MRYSFTACGYSAIAADPTDPSDLLDVRSARLLLTLLFVLGATLVIIGGWLGGELVYTWGVNVLWVE